MTNFIISSLFSIFGLTVRTFFLILPTLIVIHILEQKSLTFDTGKPQIESSRNITINEMLPRTRWGQLQSCNAYFDEKEEFEKARQCVNTKVYPDNPIKDGVNIPRCFIVPSSSADIFSKDGLNFIPIRTIMGVGGVVGFYDPPTRSIFIVENIDAARTYRHELQHLYLHINEPESGGGGHHQEIWKQCEPPFYKPDGKVKIIRDLEKLYKDLD